MSAGLELASSRRRAENAAEVSNLLAGAIRCCLMSQDDQSKGIDRSNGTMGRGYCTTRGVDSGRFILRRNAL